ncbi:hypothetical protein ACS0TY_014104 [Phlomoides rotata]
MRSLQFFFKATLLQQVDDLLKGIEKQLSDASALHKMEELKDQLETKKKQVKSMGDKVDEVKNMKEDLQQSLSMAFKEKYELEGERDRITRLSEKMLQRVKSLEQQIQDSHEQYIKNTQAEENEMEKRLRELQVQVDEANANIQKLKEEEDEWTEKIVMVDNEIAKIANQIDDVERHHQTISSRIRELHMHQRNKLMFSGLIVEERSCGRDDTEFPGYCIWRKPSY